MVAISTTFGLLISVKPSSIFAYFLETKTWTLLSAQVDEITGRRGHVMLSYDNFLIVHGGRDKQGPKDDIYSFNTGTTI